MTANECATRLAFDYKVPLFEGEAKVPNVQIFNAMRWLERNISERRMEAFYDKVKENFHPTSGTPYPLEADLKDINKYEQYPHPPKYERDNLFLTYAEANDAKFEPQDDVKHTALSTLCHEEEGLPFKEMLKKYGVKLTMQAIKYNCQHCTHPRWLECIHPEKKTCASADPSYEPISENIPAGV